MTARGRKHHGGSATRVLENGVRVVVAPQPHLQSASIAAYVRVGSRHETPENNGLTHFLEHMMFRGTERHPSAYEVSVAIEALGGTLNGATHADFTVYDVRLPAENVGAGIGMLGEIFTTPVFKDIDAERGIVREEILEGLDDEGQDVDADDVARRLLFAPHPLGLKIVGTLANLESFDEFALRAHRDRFYGGANIVLSVSGNVEVAHVFERAEAAFAAHAKGAPVPTEAPVPDGSSRFVFVHNEGSQTDVRLSYPTFGFHDPRYAASTLLLRVLDDGLSSRLYHRICDQLGLAYEAFAGMEMYEDAGVFELGASVAHDKAPEVTRELLRLADELTTTPVRDDELERVRRRYLWDLRAMQDDDGTMAAFHGTGVLFARERSIERAKARVNAVRAEDIQEVAGAILSQGRVHVSCVGAMEQATVEEVQGLV